jgi:hypothetical protein
MENETEYDKNGLAPMTDTPRTGGNPQGVSDSVATPPNGDNSPPQWANTNPAAPQAGTGGLLSRLASPTAATPNAPDATNTPFGPASVLDTMKAASARRFDEAAIRQRERELRDSGMNGRDAREAAMIENAPVTNDKGLITAYKERLLGSSPQDKAMASRYQQLMESARRGAARNPADGYSAAKNRALKTAMGQAVRQTGSAAPVPSGASRTTVRRNANGTTSRIGMVNNEEVDYGDMPENEANTVAMALADTQGIMDDFYGGDMDFMTNV